MGGDDIATQDRITHQAAILGTANWDVVFSSPSSSMRQAPRSGMGSIRFSSPANPTYCAACFRRQLSLRPRNHAAQRDRCRRPLPRGLIQLQDYDYWLRAAGQAIGWGCSTTASSPIVATPAICRPRRGPGHTHRNSHRPGKRTADGAAQRSATDLPGVHATGRRSRGSVEPVRTKRGIARPPRQEVKMRGLTKAIAFARTRRAPPPAPSRTCSATSTTPATPSVESVYGLADAPGKPGKTSFPCDSSLNGKRNLDVRRCHQPSCPRPPPNGRIRQRVRDAG